MVAFDAESGIVLCAFDALRSDPVSAGTNVGLTPVIMAVEASVATLTGNVIVVYAASAFDCNAIRALTHIGLALRTYEAEARVTSRAYLRVVRRASFALHGNTSVTEAMMGRGGGS
jgi:hypothetical protein